MKLIRVGAAVLNQTPLAWEGNQCNILGAIQAAKEQNVSVLCLPELCITGYGCEDAFHSPGVLRTAWEVLQDTVAATRGIIVSIGLPLFYQKGVFNTACLICDGQIAGFAAKQYLAGEGIHYEPRWFKPWPSGVHTEIIIGDRIYILGDIFFDCGGIKIGFEICEDAWVANRPGGGLALKGVDIILNPSASHFAFGKYEVRKRFVMEGSRAFGVSYVYSNLLGNEAGRAIYDGGALIACGGKLAAIGPRFSFADCQMTTALVDIDATRMEQARTGSFNPALIDRPDDCVQIEYSFAEQSPELSPPVHQTWELSLHLKEEEFARAISLALFDYLRKSRSQGFVVSLSGGADSSAVCCLVGLMVEFGVKELGLEGFMKRLPAQWLEVENSRDLMRKLLLCVYQSTRNSSTTTRNAACQVAGSLGAEFLELDVDEMVGNYVEIVSEAVGRELTWDRDDLALQNIQARVRSPSVWMLANLRNALLLSTSNRSEAAVGYATMDGDTSGGLSPIAGIDKAFLRRWLCWMEKNGPEGLHSFPELQVVTTQTPTAELRPQETGQTDEQDLMPYELLDAIERAAIRDKMMPVEVFQLMQSQFPQHDSLQLGKWIERFFGLWCRNQWKRERYAPSFHVDDENLDPKTWCRFPILSGGFQKELAELRVYVESTRAK